MSDGLLEYYHINLFAYSLQLDINKIDPKRDYTRSQIDAIAVLQLMEVQKRVIDSNPELVRSLQASFDFGFTAGRIFSAIQNLHTLEPHAQERLDALEKNREKGKKSGSGQRRLERLEAMMAEAERIYAENEDFRDNEHVILKAAFGKVIKKGSYGSGQFEAYRTALSSEEPFKQRFDALFR